MGRMGRMKIGVIIKDNKLVQLSRHKDAYGTKNTTAVALAFDVSSDKHEQNTTFGDSVQVLFE